MEDNKGDDVVDFISIFDQRSTREMISDVEETKKIDHRSSSIVVMKA